jgi:alkylation response protein AidB-like acyl-CoA dehydrogenase
MRFAFTEEQLLFRDSLRDVLQKECMPVQVRAAWSDETGRVPGLWRRLAELGVVGLTVPEPYGGLGMGELDLVLLLEESGRAAMPEPLVETTAVGVPLLRDLPDTALSDRWLPGVAAGDVVLTVGLEPAPFVIDAHVADLLILQRGDALFAVTPERIGLEPQRSVDGSRRLFRVRWEPRAPDLVAEGRAARQAIDAAFDRGALAVSAQLLGLARQMIDLTVAYVKVREQFGKPIGSFQAVKHHLADALLRLEFAAPVVHRAAYSVAGGASDRSVHVSMAKVYASEAAEMAARVALQCHGAIGYAFEHDLHLWMKRAWALSASWGDSGWHRARVGTAVLGRESA